MATIVQCNCGAEYRRTEEKFLAPQTGDAICTVCGAALESWSESTNSEIQIARRNSVSISLILEISCTVSVYQERAIENIFLLALGFRSFSHGQDPTRT
jgi:hypothetical protein